MKPPLTEKTIYRLLIAVAIAGAALALSQGPRRSGYPFESYLNSLDLTD